MNEIEVRQPNEHLRASPALSAILDAVRSSIPLARRDLTPQMVAEARAIASGSVQPASPVVIAAWLKKLALLVVNAPQIAGPACGQVRAMAEICGKLPAAVWCPETRKAWCQQGMQGKFWPAPAELYAHLLPYADRIKRDTLAARRVVALADREPEPRPVISAEERAAVVAQMEALRREREAREAEEARVREFGAYMPGNDTTLRGWDLIRALEGDLPKMAGDMRAFTVERLAVLKQAAEAADALLGYVKNA